MLGARATMGQFLLQQQKDKRLKEQFQDLNLVL